jgi:glycosyltransferase involved in cell wall biosynthesis
MSILLLIPEAYSSRGGVQAYMRRLAEILSAFAEERGGALDCVSLADAGPNLEAHPNGVRYREFCGARGSKAAFARMAAQLARAQKPRLVVVGHAGLAPVAWGLSLAGLIPPYVLVLHGWEAWRRVEHIKRMAAARAAAIVATTDYTGREFCRLNGIPPELACVIPLAVPPAEQIAERRRGANTALRVLTVCRLARGASYKGVDTLIEAAAWMRDAKVPMQLTVAGDGDDFPRLRHRALELELEDYVSFQGDVADADLQPLYRDCDVFALPSKGEGFGIVFLEAMACGKPCIGGNHGGTPEVIEDGEDGFLVEHGDVAGLAGRLIALARDPALARIMGERARRKVHRRFLFEHMRARWFALLDRIETAAAGRRQRELPRAAGY